MLYSYRKHARKLNTFHHWCIRTILGVSNRQQWSEHITTAAVRKHLDDMETANEKFIKRRFEWLGHLAMIPDHRLPKTILFGWLFQPCPRCSPRRTWSDKVL